MKRKELTKTFMTISNQKKFILVFVVYANIFQRCKGYIYVHDQVGILHIIDLIATKIRSRVCQSNNAFVSPAYKIIT